MKVIVYHHSKQHIYKIVESLEKGKIPYEFYTGLYHTCLGKKLREIFPSLQNTRFYEGINPNAVTCINTSHEILFSIWAKLNIFMRARNRLLFKKQLLFQKKLLQLMPQDITHIITLHTNAFHLYKQIKKIGWETSLILEAAQPHPEWIYKLYRKYTAYEKYLPLDYTKTMVKTYSDEFEHADIIVAPSTFVKKTLEQYGVKKEKIRIIYYGFNSPELKIEKNKQTFGGKLKIAFCGIVSPSKGFHFLKEVAKRTQKHLEFHIFGTPVRRNFVKNLPSNIYLHGYVNHAKLFEYYGHMDVFYFPTLYDASGLALLESMRAGLVPIASPYSIAPDIIKNGTNGFIVKPDNIDATVNTLLKLHSDRRLLRNLSKESEKSIQKFSWENYQKGYIRLIMEKGRLKSPFES